MAITAESWVMRSQGQVADWPGGEELTAEVDSTNLTPTSTVFRGVAGGGTLITDSGQSYESRRVRFTSGTLSGEIQRIDASSDKTSGTEVEFSFATGFTGAPANGDTFVIESDTNGFLGDGVADGWTDVALVVFNRDGDFAGLTGVQDFSARQFTLKYGSPGYNVGDQAGVTPETVPVGYQLRIDQLHITSSLGYFNNRLYVGGVGFLTMGAPTPKPTFIFARDSLAATEWRFMVQPAGGGAWAPLRPFNRVSPASEFSFYTSPSIALRYEDDANRIAWNPGGGAQATAYNMISHGTMHNEGTNTQSHSRSFEFRLPTPIYLNEGEKAKIQMRTADEATGFEYDIVSYGVLVPAGSETTVALDGALYTIVPLGGQV